MPAARKLSKAARASLDEGLTEARAAVAGGRTLPVLDLAKYDAKPAMRTKQFLVRVTPEQHAAIIAAARDSNRSVSDFCRLAGLHCAAKRVKL